MGRGSTTGPWRNEPGRESRFDEPATLVAAAAAGLAAALSDASPTGSRPTDAVLIALSVGLVTWASATAPW